MNLKKINIVIKAQKGRRLRKWMIIFVILCLTDVEYKLKARKD